MRLAALNHSLWKLLAAQYSIGIIGTARLGKSTLVAELSGQNTAAGEGKSCHTHTVHTYENKDALGINIMDFPGVDDLGAHARLRRRSFFLLVSAVCYCLCRQFGNCAAGGK